MAAEGQAPDQPGRVSPRRARSDELWKLRAECEGVPALAEMSEEAEALVEAESRARGWDALKGRVQVVDVKAGDAPSFEEWDAEGERLFKEGTRLLHEIDRAVADQAGWRSLETILWAAIRGSVVLISCFVALWIVMTAIGALSSYPPAFYWVMVALACTAALSVLVVYACFPRARPFE